MRTKPYTATLVITPLMSADTWLGAAGCASGNQTCSGTSPALEPAPSRASARTAAASGGGEVRIADRVERVAAGRDRPGGQSSSSSDSVPRLAISK